MFESQRTKIFYTIVPLNPLLLSLKKIERWGGKETWSICVSLVGLMFSQVFAKSQLEFQIYLVVHTILDNLTPYNCLRATLGWAWEGGVVIHSPILKSSDSREQFIAVFDEQFFRPKLSKTLKNVIRWFDVVWSCLIIVW